MRGGAGETEVVLGWATREMCCGWKVVRLFRGAGKCGGGGHQVGRQEAAELRDAVAEGGRSVTAGVVAEPRDEGSGVGGPHHVARKRDILPGARQGGEVEVVAAHVREREHDDAGRR